MNANNIESHIVMHTGRQKKTKFRISKLMIVIGGGRVWSFLCAGWFYFTKPESPTVCWAITVSGLDCSTEFMAGRVGLPSSNFVSLSLFSHPSEAGPLYSSKGVCKRAI